MRNSILLITMLISVMLFSGCKEDDEVNPDRLEVTVESGSLHLNNRSKDDLYLFIIDRNSLALIQWAPSVEGDPDLEAKSSITVNFEDIAGYTDDTEEIVVNFWKAVREDGDRVPGEIESKVVAL